MPDRKMVPCSSSYLSASETSGRLSLTGRALRDGSAGACAGWWPAVRSVVVSMSGVMKPSRSPKVVRSLYHPVRFPLVCALELAEVLVHHGVNFVWFPAAQSGKRALVDPDRPFGH